MKKSFLSNLITYLVLFFLLLVSAQSVTYSLFYILSQFLSDGATAVISFTAFVLLTLGLVKLNIPSIFPAAPQNTATYAGCIILIGVILRAVLAVALWPEQSSDSATYIQLAQNLIEKGEYTVAGTYAYWPPGLPLFYAVYFKYLSWIDLNIFIKLTNILLYVAISALAYLFSTRFLDRRSALFTLAILAIWPDYIALTLVASKEHFVILLLLLAAFLYQSTEKVSLNILIAGISLGLACLFQPGCLPFVAFFIFYEIVCGTSGLKSAGRLFVLILFMCIAISPWSYRNYQVLNEFVPISSNGGYNLYRANNPLATGGYTDRGEVDLSHLDELEQSKQGKELALKWIKEEPLDFFMLTLTKQYLFLGDNSSGVFAALKRGLDWNGWKYNLPKLIANLYWILLWLIIAAGLVKYFRYFLSPNYLILPAMCFLYFYFIHSIFESSSKYHVPGIAFLAIVAGHIVHLLTKKDER